MKKCTKIYTGDYTEEGYEDGFDDVKNSKPKNKFKFFKAVHPINLIWNFDNSLSSYSTSYDIGYIDGERDKHNLYKNNIKQKENSMSVISSYEEVISVLKDTKRNLDNAKEELEHRIKNYQDHINTAKNNKWMTNYIIPLQEKYNNLYNKINTLKNIIDMLKNQIDTDIQQLVRLIETAKNNN